MTYDITLFINSGFDAINIPDSPETLALSVSQIIRTIPSVELLQNRGLTQVDIKATWGQVENADYIKIGDLYYAITGVPHMQSTQVARLSLTGVMLLSTGGFSAGSDGTVSAGFSILGGVTERCTVNDDSWGAYTTADPLIAPQEPLQIKTEWLSPTGSGDIPAGITEDPVFVESTVNLPSQGNDLATEGRTYTDEETGETVTVPEIIPISTDSLTGKLEVTSFTFPDGGSVDDGTMVFCRNDVTKDTDSRKNAGQSIVSGIDAVRSLGVEQGTILNQWRVPRVYIGEIKATYSSMPVKADDGSISSQYTDERQTLTSISGAKGTFSGTINPNYATVKNKRLLYGEYAKYGLMTTAGNSGEFDPEVITGEGTPPQITFESDIRPKGKPYFRFSMINQNSEFWRNALAGSEWQEVPLVYQGASGSALTRINYDNEVATQKLQYEQANARWDMGFAGRLASGLSGLAETLAGAGLTAGTGGAGVALGGTMIASGVSNLGGAIAGGASDIQSIDQYKETYDRQRANEMSGLYQQTTVYVPSVNFPYNADILRDIKGNSVLLYKYEMSESDLARCDKLLTMYGYKVTEPLTLGNFMRRQKFDYVACSNISIGGLPRWQADEISAELQAGVRVWHTKPTPSAYSDNPIR